MPNTVRANARTMPIARRAVLASIAAAGAAIFAAPQFANAAVSPDADLFAVVARAKALIGQSKAALQAIEAAHQRYIRPATPQALIEREGDTGLFPLLEPRVGSALGKKRIRRARAYLRQSAECGEHCSGPWQGTTPAIGDHARLTQRAAEIVAAFGDYRNAVDAEKAAAGINDARELANRIGEELRATLRKLALTPAQTRNGVLAKVCIAGLSLTADPMNADALRLDLPGRDLAYSAARDLAGILETVEA